MVRGNTVSHCEYNCFQLGANNDMPTAGLLVASNVFLRDVPSGLYVFGERRHGW